MSPGSPSQIKASLFSPGFQMPVDGIVNEIGLPSKKPFIKWLIAAIQYPVPFLKPP